MYNTNSESNEQLLAEILSTPSNLVLTDRFTQPEAMGMADCTGKCEGTNGCKGSL